MNKNYGLYTKTKLKLRLSNPNEINYNYITEIRSKLKKKVSESFYYYTWYVYLNAFKNLKKSNLKKVEKQNKLNYFDKLLILSFPHQKI